MQLGLEAPESNLAKATGIGTRQIVPVQHGWVGDSNVGDGNQEMTAPLAIMDKPASTASDVGKIELPGNSQESDLMRQQLISGVNRLKAELAIMG